MAYTPLPNPWTGIPLVGALIDAIQTFLEERPVQLQGNGDPNGSVVATVGSTYQRLDGGANTSFYVKESGSGNTGWAAK